MPICPILPPTLYNGKGEMPMLDFKGKQHIYAHHLTVPYRPLEPDNDRSINSTGVDNDMIIHGDNLQALMTFQLRYSIWYARS